MQAPCRMPDRHLTKKQKRLTKRWLQKWYRDGKETRLALDGYPAVTLPAPSASGAGPTASTTRPIQPARRHWGAAEPQVLPHLTAQQRAGPDGQIEHTGENRQAHVGGIAAPVQHQGLHGQHHRHDGGPPHHGQGVQAGGGVPGPAQRTQAACQGGQGEAKSPAAKFQAPTAEQEAAPGCWPGPKISSTKVVTAGLWPARTCTEGSM